MHIKAIVNFKLCIKIVHRHISMSDDEKGRKLNVALIFEMRAQFLNKLPVYILQDGVWIKTSDCRISVWKIG